MVVPVVGVRPMDMRMQDLLVDVLMAVRFEEGIFVIMGMMRIVMKVGMGVF